MTDKFSRTEVDIFKQLAAERAVDFVNSGMVVGLGTGSTAELAIERLGQRIVTGELTDVVGIATSKESERKALRNGIELTTLDKYSTVDLTIDGADEVDSRLNLIKGAGGALFREKIVSEASTDVIIAVDESKLSDNLGSKSSVPVEVIPFAIRPIAEYLRQLGALVKLREDSGGNVFRTEQGNNIIDCQFGKIENPGCLAQKLSQKSGIVEHGIFSNPNISVIVGGNEGIRHLKH